MPVVVVALAVLRVVLATEEVEDIVKGWWVDSSFSQKSKGISELN